MSERPEKRKIEFIESYWTGGKYGSDYVWNDNHGELVRCKDCKFYNENSGVCYRGIVHGYAETWFCADGERRDGDG